jgi:crossover junction endodeoxyribonuclease RuvC
LKTDKNYLLENQKPLLFLGIDPGSEVLGYAAIEYSVISTSVCLKDSGALFLKGELKERLAHIFSFFTKFLSTYSKDYIIVFCLETPFLSKFPHAYFVLGQVRGVLLLLCSQHNCLHVDITPAEVKKIITSSGGASKANVKDILSLFFDKEFATLDESDACAVAFSSLRRLSSSNFY